MTFSLPRSVATAPVAPDRNATIALTMVVTVLVVAGAAVLAMRTVEALATAPVDVVLTVAAVALAAVLAIGTGVLVARDAEWVQPAPRRR